MTVEKFIEEYEKCNDTEKYITDKVIVDKYINYEEKIAICKKLIDRCMYSRINENKIYMVNTPIRYCLHKMSLIDLYTNIDVDFQDILKDFNMLEKNHVTDLIIDKIDKFEMKMFSQILNWCFEDEIENERNLVSYIDNKIGILDLIGKMS